MAEMTVEQARWKIAHLGCMACSDGTEVELADSIIAAVRAEQRQTVAALVESLQALVSLAEQRGRLHEYAAALAEARAALALVKEGQ